MVAVVVVEELAAGMEGIGTGGQEDKLIRESKPTRMRRRC
jgi:hypothetical protein